MSDPSDTHRLKKPGPKAMTRFWLWVITSVAWAALDLVQFWWTGDWIGSGVEMSIGFASACFILPYGGKDE